MSKIIDKKAPTRVTATAQVVTQEMPAAKPVALAPAQRPVILVDCDGVLADLAGYVAKRLHRAVESFTSPDFAQCSLSETELAHVSRIAHHPDTARFPEIYPGAHEFLQVLAPLGEVTIATKPWKSPYWYHARIDWLAANLGIAPEQVIFAHDKSLLRGDVLVEDNADNLAAWLAANPGALGVLISRPWNSGSAVGVRVASLAGAVSAIEAHFAALAGVAQ